MVNTVDDAKEFEKKSCGDVLTISFPSALRAKYLDIVKWSKSGKPIDARKAGVNLAKKSNKNDILMCVGIQLHFLNTLSSNGNP